MKNSNIQATPGLVMINGQVLIIITLCLGDIKFTTYQSLN